MTDERIINLRSYIDSQILKSESKLSDAKTNSYKERITNLEGQMHAYRMVRMTICEIFPVFDNKC